MPELPEVETVKEVLKKKLLNKRIKDVMVYYDKIIEYPDVLTFKSQITNQVITDIKRRGKWLVFVLDDYYLLSHLRMEGKFFFRKINDYVSKHEHVSIIFDDFSLRFQDTRKFGKMYLIKKELINTFGPLKELGYEPWNNKLDVSYLKNKFHNKRIPIKTGLLDQSIIAGIGNIYADEILFMSRVNPLKKCCLLDEIELSNIIKNTQYILLEAIKAGGTTIRSYTSSEGVHGRFQQKLLVHNRDNHCDVCSDTIIKIKVGGRGTYYCPTCQK